MNNGLVCTERHNLTPRRTIPMFSTLTVGVSPNKSVRFVRGVSHLLHMWWWSARAPARRAVHVFFFL
jgi:hypothetical protein